MIDLYAKTELSFQGIKFFCKTETKHNQYSGSTRDFLKNELQRICRSELSLHLGKGGVICL